MNKVKFATVWLDGCSGCHMSFLDMDERLLEIGSRVEVVSGAFVDSKVYPENVDLVLVEGAVGTVEDREKLIHIRRNTKHLVALGDCAINGNVPAMRNYFDKDEVLRRSYLEDVDHNPVLPDQVPPLEEKDIPIHQVVHVDFFLPGCPPPADAIYGFLMDLLEGRTPEIRGRTRIGL